MGSPPGCITARLTGPKGNPPAPPTSASRSASTGACSHEEHPPEPPQTLVGTSRPQTSRMVGGFSLLPSGLYTTGTGSLMAAVADRTASQMAPQQRSQPWAHAPTEKKIELYSRVRLGLGLESLSPARCGCTLALPPAANFDAPPVARGWVPCPHPPSLPCTGLLCCVRHRR